MKNNHFIWNACKWAVVLIVVLTFTPLVTPIGKYSPPWLGMPYTLWVGIVEAFILVGIAWLGTRVHPGRDE